MFCRKCGNQIPDDSVFCPKCGTAIEKEISGQINSQPAETVTESTNTVSMTYSESANSDTVSAVQTALDDTRLKKSNKPLIITLTVAVIAVVLAAVIIPITVSKNKEAHREFEYHIKADDTYVISKYLGTNLNVVIPNEIDGKPVSEIGERAFSESSVESVTIGKNVWEIGDSAFSNCSNLHFVEILPNDDFVIDFIEGDILIKSIGGNAFANCSALETVIFPDNYTEIGAKAFFQCSALKSVELMGIMSVGEKAFSESGLQSVNLHTGETYPAVFADCKDLKEVTLGNLVDISDEMFSGCTSLETVNWNFSPYMNNEIGSKAFYGCTSLKQFNTIDTPITYPRGFSEFIEEFRSLGSKDVVIAEDAFENCGEFKDPEPTTKHNEWAGTCYLGKTLREAIKYANDWEMSTYFGNCVKFYDPLGVVIANECYDYINYKVYQVVLNDENRYLSSDLGKTDFVYVGITLNEVFGLLGQTQINNNVVMESYTVSYNLYGYNFELHLSGSSLNSIVTSVWIRNDY